MTSPADSLPGPILSAAAPLSGTVAVPGDKSVGHRSLLIGALADGPVEVTGLSHGEDNLATARILGQLGVRIARDPADPSRATVHGVGLHGFRAPSEPLDCGNSGTTMRLMLGLLTGQPFEATLVGDASLSRRPMRRVLAPLSQMGLEVLEARDGNLPPLRVRGTTAVRPLRYASPVASAQVKSAIMLAGLYADGETSVTEPEQSRDHTERMLAYLGRPPAARPLHVPGDLSSAAFVLGAALLVPGSDVTVAGVGINPTRTGFLEAIAAMGADVHTSHELTSNHEPRADLRAVAGPLRAIRIDGALAVKAIDELPLLAVLAARAAGVTSIRDAAELRVKESDRIAKTAELLEAFGVPCEVHRDGLDVHGDPDRPLKAGRIDADGDHRIAMCATLLTLIAPPGAVITGVDAIATSFPTFYDVMAAIGAEIQPRGEGLP